MARQLITFGATLLLTACADTHHLVKNHPIETRLSPEDTIFIAVPNDGSYGSTTYRGSGQNTAQIIYAAFAKHSRTVVGGQSNGMVGHTR